jgi:hypothetical protein
MGELPTFWIEPRFQEIGKSFSLRKERIIKSGLNSLISHWRLWINRNRLSGLFKKFRKFYAIKHLPKRFCGSRPSGELWHPQKVKEVS